MTDASSLVHVIEKTQPRRDIQPRGSESRAVSFEEPEYTANSDALGTLRILEAIRILRMEKPVRFYQASTSEITDWSRNRRRPKRPLHPRSPYAVAKLYAYWITVNYREATGYSPATAFCSTMSRPPGARSSSPERSRARWRASSSACRTTVPRQSDARRDWGHARDYVEAQWLMLQQAKPEDYVIATGSQHSGAGVRRTRRKALGIEIDWKGQGVAERGFESAGKCIVAVDPRYPSDRSRVFAG